MSSLSVYESSVHELDVRWDPFLDESNEAQLPGYTKAHQSTLYYSAYTWGLRPRSSLERRTLAGSEALLSFAYSKEEGALIPELGWRAEPAEPPAGEWLVAHLFGEGGSFDELGCGSENPKLETLPFFATHYLRSKSEAPSTSRSSSRLHFFNPAALLPLYSTGSLLPSHWQEPDKEQEREAAQFQRLGTIATRAEGDVWDKRPVSDEAVAPTFHRHIIRSATTSELNGRPSRCTACDAYALHEHLNVQDKRNEGKNRRGECSRRENSDSKGNTGLRELCATSTLSLQGN
ncbi:hypothetical protein FXO37_27775 [Capsicum annuum]|nr:hypothetical protein FXO37_27775 [Capsicum annuum]